MILVHLIVGIMFGVIAAAILWLFDYPLWLMLMSYSLGGSLGLLTSALVGLASSWLTDNGRRRECRPSPHELASDGP